MRASVLTLQLARHHIVRLVLLVAAAPFLIGWCLNITASRQERIGVLRIVRPHLVGAVLQPPNNFEFTATSARLPAPVSGAVVKIVVQDRWVEVRLGHVRFVLAGDFVI